MNVNSGCCDSTVPSSKVHGSCSLDGVDECCGMNGTRTIVGHRMSSLLDCRGLSFTSMYSSVALLSSNGPSIISITPSSSSYGDDGGGGGGVGDSGGSVVGGDGGDGRECGVFHRHVVWSGVCRSKWRSCRWWNAVRIVRISWRCWRDLILHAHLLQEHTLHQDCVL